MGTLFVSAAGAVAGAAIAVVGAASVALAAMASADNAIRDPRVRSTGLAVLTSGTSGFDC
jgi:hypothetical protein